MVPPILGGGKPLFFQPTPPVSNFTFPLMSTSPPKFFYETFFEYVQPYMVACEELATRAQILNDCVEAVYESPLYNNKELPENLHLVSISVFKASYACRKLLLLINLQEIFKQFMSYLDDNDRGKEE